MRLQDSGRSCRENEGACAGEARSVSTQLQRIPAWHYPFILMLLVTLVLGAFRRGLELYARFTPKRTVTAATVTVAGE